MMLSPMLVLLVLNLSVDSVVAGVGDVFIAAENINDTKINNDKV